MDPESSERGWDQGSNHQIFEHDEIEYEIEGTKGMDQEHMDGKIYVPNRMIPLLEFIASARRDVHNVKYVVPFE